MGPIVETEWTRLLPYVDHVFYGRPVAGYDEGAGCIVGGHDRRAYAAVNRMCREEGSFGRAVRVPTDARWVVLHTTCGCTSEQHAEHVDCYDEYEEQRCGLPPCGDEYAWMPTTAGPSTPGAVPVLEVCW